jgi:hypothetical protein
MCASHRQVIVDALSLLFVGSKDGQCLTPVLAAAGYFSAMSSPVRSLLQHPLSPSLLAFCPSAILIHVPPSALLAPLTYPGPFTPCVVIARTAPLTPTARHRLSDGLVSISPRAIVYADLCRPPSPMLKRGVSGQSLHSTITSRTDIDRLVISSKYL